MHGASSGEEARRGVVLAVQRRAGCRLQCHTVLSDLRGQRMVMTRWLDAASQLDAAKLARPCPWKSCAPAL